MIPTAAGLTASARAVGVSERALTPLLDALSAVSSDQRFEATLLSLVERLNRRDLRALSEIEEWLATERRASAFRLLIALLQLPTTLAKHARRGVGEAMSVETFRDLGLWVRHFDREEAGPGLTAEILAWAQEYLVGDLLKIDGLQFELKPSDRPLRVFVHNESGEAITFAEEGIAVGSDGLFALDGETAFVTRWFESDERVQGHVIEPRNGTIEREPFTLDLRDWRCVVERGAPVLELHIPEDFRISRLSVARAIQSARQVFARLQPGVMPRAAVGDAWLLDPQIRGALPRNRGIHDLQKYADLFPSALPEHRTLTRLFGVKATRMCVLMRPTESMNVLQRSVVGILRTSRLNARGALILLERAERLAVAP
ncbi:MAG: acyltransferase domain-containing protein [Myxococcaceae bacterium]